MSVRQGDVAQPHLLGCAFPSKRRKTDFPHEKVVEFYMGREFDGLHERGDPVGHLPFSQRKQAQTRPFRSRVADRNDLIDRNAWEHAQSDGLFPIQIIAERTRKVDPVDLGCFDFHFLKQNRNARRNGGLGKLELPDIHLRNDNVPFVALLASKGQHKFPHTADRA